MPDREPLIPKHGGYRKLKSFQVARLVFDVTVRFCDRYIDKYSRTRDQMVQAARSGVQNIAEGSQASGTSKKTELKLTNVARASLEELRLDYEDFLRQRGMTMLPPDHPALMRFKKKRCATLQNVQAWVREERGRQRTDQHRQTRANKDGGKRPVLLICPMSVVGNWQKEAARFTPELPVLVHHGVTRAKGAAFKKEARKQAMVISRYALLHRDYEILSGLRWAGVVLDEAQNIKNPETKQAKLPKTTWTLQIRCGEPIHRSRHQRTPFFPKIRGLASG